MNRKTLKTNLIIITLTLFTAMSQVSFAGNFNKPEDFIPGRQLRQRLAVNKRTIAATSEKTPNSALSVSKVISMPFSHLNHLVKIVPGIEKSGKVFWSDNAKNLKVEDEPGSVIADFEIDGVQIESEFTPLLVNSDTGNWAGSVLYKIKTKPETKTVLQISGGIGIYFAHLRWPEVLDENKKLPLIDLKIKNNIASLISSNENLFVCFKSSGNMSENTNGNVIVSFDNGSGWIMFSFSVKKEVVEKLIQSNAIEDYKKLKEHYKKLMKSSLETPVKSMDEAFSSAIYNLEYSWIPPYGWNECPRHWNALWHMQVTAGAEWLGQTDRSLLCTMTHANNLLKNGSAPEFFPDGTFHDSFGGSSHFWAWQVKHYLDFTGDEKFAKEIIEPFQTNLNFVFTERDPDRDLLIFWKQQIGNQEDFNATPYDGTTPTIEGINMLKTRALLAGIQGDKETADFYNAKAVAALKILKEKLWMNDLGRFAFYIDPTGKLFLDGQYQTYSYPTIWGIVDEFDSYTGLRHFRDRFQGTNGEIYCANLWPTHHPGTWGSQAGAAQQPWGAWAFSKAGLNNETYRPLNAVAEWVMDLNHRGSWPEVSVETINAYFTPPAGLYIAAVAEALFGMNINRIEDTMTISPSFPDKWPYAKLSLPEYHADYKREGNTINYTIKNSRPIGYKIKWSFPPARIKQFFINGKKAEYKIEPGIGRIILNAIAQKGKEINISIETEPLKYSVKYPKSIGEGENFDLNIQGAEILDVKDRAGLLKNWTLKKNGVVSCILNKNLLDKYKGYGRLGQLNFSRRTFFVLCESKSGIKFWEPIDFAVLPPVEIAATGTAKIKNNNLIIPVKIRNNTSMPIENMWVDVEGKRTTPTQVAPPHLKQEGSNVAIASRSEKEMEFSLPKDFVNKLSQGDNKLKLFVPEIGEVDFIVSFDGQTKKNISKLIQIELPESEMIADKDYLKTRSADTVQNIWHFYASIRNIMPLQGLEGQTNITIPGIKDFPMKIINRKFIPVSGQLGKPMFKVSLPAGKYKKFWILVLPIIDWHDMFSPVALVTLKNEVDKVVYWKKLYLPGDLDYWWNKNIPFINFASAQEKRSKRNFLLPRPSTKNGDWNEGKPPHFPHYDDWADCRNIITPSCVLDVIELDLPVEEDLKSLQFETVGVDPAFGILGIIGEIELPTEHTK